MKSTKLANKVLLIGWDAADWKVIRPLMEAGYMPALQQLMENGAHGRLATLEPPLSPILWTSIATGKLPYKHGIHGFTEPKPDGSGVRPITNLNRKTKAFWNILSQEGFKTHVVGWWPSHPAEKINGTMISNFFHQAPSVDITDPWPLTAGTVHPAEKAGFYAKLRVHPGELTAQHILPFVPRAAEIDQKKDTRLTNIAKTTADCSTIQATATYILEHEPWDVTAVYFDAIDHYCHGFMRYHPPRRPHISQQDFDLYHGVVAGGYRYHDMMLARLLQLAGPETTVILISDHGFHPDHLRPHAIPREPSGPAAEHSPYGIICMAGPGIKKGASIIGAGLLDITPTLLTLMGLPVGKDMDGKVLINVLETSHLPTPILSWDAIEGDSGMHEPGMELDAEIEAQAMEQLVALGYVEAPGEQAAQAIQKTKNENAFYLARSFMHSGRLDEAAQLLEPLHSQEPGQFRYGLHLMQVYIQLSRVAEARGVFEGIKSLLAVSIDAPSLNLNEGNLLLAENKVKQALDCFRRAKAQDAGRAGIYLQLGRSFIKLGQWEDARGAFEQELALDPENAEAWHGLGLAELQLGQAQPAAEHILHAIGLMYHSPVMHFHLGEALCQLNQFDAAADAFSTTLRLAPQMNPARRALARIYTEQLGKPEQAAALIREIPTYVKGTITVVSGLPRSGTSMMMQMLKAGGMEVLTDNQREADDSNPLGYFEYEAVKRLARDKRWLPQATGKAVKIIAQLLSHLPPDFHYKVIFMERDLVEVVNSQQKMLSRLGKVPADMMPYHLRDNFEKVLREVKASFGTQPEVEICFVNHQDVISKPFQEAFRVNEFLGGQLSVEKMALVVNPSLHREHHQISTEKP